MYFEGLDQYCGWFQLFLKILIVMNGKVLYCQVLIYGFMVDGKGYKMFKFLGNVIVLQEVMNELGVDILWLWVVVMDYSGEMMVFKDILCQIVDGYCWICNIFCFLLSNFNGFDLDQYMVVLEDMIVLDCWMVDCVFQLQNELYEDYQNYVFLCIYQKVYNFCEVILGGFYFDIIKDCQYIMFVDSLICCFCQIVLYYVVEVLVCWIVLILSFIVDEIWQYLSGQCGDIVFYEIWYEGLIVLLEIVEFGWEYWCEIFGVKEVVNKCLEDVCV